MSADNTKTGVGEVGRFTKFLADHCNNCAMCRYAREKPDTTFGKIMHWHGTWCPAWKAQQKVYGEQSAE
jgi:hypothetical protein